MIKSTRLVRTVLVACAVGTTALVAPLSKKIGVKISYQILYSGNPPPGFKTTDRILTTSLQVNI